MDDIRTKWVELVRRLALNPNPDRMIGSGIRYFRDVTFEITGEEWNNGFPVPLADLGYEGRSTKINQLTKNYLNPESIEAARNKLTERVNKKADYTSVMFTMQGGDKDKRSQGHCMSNTVITYNPKNYGTGGPTLNVDVYYRVTEVIKKFGADLVFLHDIVIPEAMKGTPVSPKDITSVKFHFANIYLSPLFLPIMVPQMDVIGLIYDISKNQPYEALRGCYNALANLTADPNHYSYRTRRKMCSFLQDKISEEDRFKYLDCLHKLQELNPKLKEVTE